MCGLKSWKQMMKSKSKISDRYRIQKDKKKKKQSRYLNHNKSTWLTKNVNKLTTSLFYRLHILGFLLLYQIHYSLV